MDWSGIMARLKDARTWSIIISLVNAVMAYLAATQQVTLIVNIAVMLVAFVLFGVEPVIRAIRARRSK